MGRRTETLGDGYAKLLKESRLGTSHYGGLSVIADHIA